MIKSILLTGHTGFLGSVIYRELKKEFNVLTVGRNASCDYIVDFSDWDGYLELFEVVDTVVHVAGLAHKKAHSQEEMKKVNVTAVDLLLKFAHSKSIKNFIFISSVSVYGKNYGLDITEESKLNPQTSFGRSKRDSEILVSNWGRKNNSNFLSLRLPLILGSNPPGNLGRLIHSIKKGQHIYLNGNKAERSIVFSTDVSAFIKNWLLSSDKKSGAINLSNNTAPTFNWIEKALVQRLDTSFRISLPITFLLNFVVFMRKYLRISLPFLGKLFFSITISDSLARKEYGYTSKELNQSNFNNELNSNN
jgi:nucleoside-diphosphate-sugar epimerase